LPPSARPSPPRRGALAGGLALLVAALCGCSSSGSSTPKADPSLGDQVGGARVVASQVVLGTVAGTVHQPGQRVFKKHRKAVLREVGAAVDTWLDGGFVGVDYPRDSFDQAFTAFTGPARSDAEKQKSLMTNWRLRSRIEEVTVRKRQVVVDVLAPRGHAVAATARVRLVFTTAGDTQRRVVVAGRLFLTPDGRSWHIFGYDVSQGGSR